MSWRGERSSLLSIFRGVLLLYGMSFSLSSSPGTYWYSGMSSSSVGALNQLIRWPMISNISLLSDDSSSFSFSMILLKLLVNQKRKSGLDDSGLSAYENSAMWKGEQNCLLYLLVAVGLMEASALMLNYSRDCSMSSQGIQLDIRSRYNEDPTKLKLIDSGQRNFYLQHNRFGGIIVRISKPTSKTPEVERQKD